MADYATKDPQTVEKYEFEYKKDYLEDWAIHQQYVLTFDAYEAMLIGQVYDTVSRSVDSSKITDSYAATLAIERAARVMGKLPDGVTESVAKGDQGKAAFMDILRQKWIYPNANSQHRFETKLRLWQMYSSIYGYMPMFFDWNVAPSGYAGPDCWLYNPRNLVPQQGRTSLADMDYLTALTWVGKKYLENKLAELESGTDEDKESGGWDITALKMLIEFADQDKSRPDLQKDTQIARNRTPQAVKRGICLATRYEAGDDGEWCTFAPDHGFIEVRRLPNPHKNGRIPFVIKYSQPLFDSFYGLGDFQRAKPLQFARDGLTNLYFSGIKNNLVPPLVANANGVVKHTLDYRPGGVILETLPNSVRTLEVSSAGLSTYQAAMSALTGSLLSLYGSQNASIPGTDTLNPSQGKTPAAIGLYSDKEADRDGQEREYLEGAIEELTDGFFSLIANIGTEDIPVNLFSADIQGIVDAGMTDIVGIFQGLPSKTARFSPNDTQTGGQLKIDPTKLQGIEYRFNIDDGSTAKQNKQAISQELDDFIGIISKLQNVIQNDPRVKVNWDEIMKAKETLSDIPGASKFMTINPNAQPQPEPPQPPKINELINYKDAPADIQAQIEQMAGLQPSQMRAQQMQQQMAETQAKLTPPPPEPTVAPNGTIFHDPHIGAAATAIHKL